MELKNIKNYNTLEFFNLEDDVVSSITMFTESVQAGFPSPADDHIDMQMNLHDHLVNNADSTFCVRAIGESMKDAGIKSGDIMIVDRAVEPKNRSIILALIDGEFTVKRVNVNDEELYLMPENSNFVPIKITKEMDFKVWGVVTYIIHKAI